MKSNLPIYSVNHTSIQSGRRPSLRMSYGIFSTLGKARRCIAREADYNSAASAGYFTISRWVLDRPHSTAHEWYYDNKGKFLSNSGMRRGWSPDTSGKHYSLMDIVAIESFPFNINSTEDHDTIGVITMLPDEAGRYCVDFVNRAGFLDHSHLPQEAFRKASAEESAMLDSYLRFVFLETESIHELPGQYHNWAERQYFPVAGVSNIHELIFRAKNFGYHEVVCLSSG